MFEVGPFDSAVILSFFPPAVFFILLGFFSGGVGGSVSVSVGFGLLGLWRR